jgi:hypothetical protein
MDFHLPLCKLIQWEPYYRSTSGRFKSVTKKRSLHTMSTEVTEAGNCDNPKLKDIQKLREKHYSKRRETDSSLKFYTNLILSATKLQQRRRRKEPVQSSY